ncbi:hypothetical protein BLNAU_6197 [Blattamonas nauphoetae]|uniref:OTU domain-containing protein n=1 Tax=Blattamonas nauphoetae TaxID=2049346 RepID=A0ABQ9Y5C0_9EUKA|nr:hypothetical protein BLNAU_6197 [Blattamonas nauphoetae]
MKEISKKEKLGGVGKVVEIDECWFSKGKGHGGKPRFNYTILGGVEKEEGKPSSRIDLKTINPAHLNRKNVVDEIQFFKDCGSVSDEQLSLLEELQKTNVESEKEADKMRKDVSTQRHLEKIAQTTTELAETTTHFQQLSQAREKEVHKVIEKQKRVESSKSTVKTRSQTKKGKKKKKEVRKSSIPGAPIAKVNQQVTSSGVVDYHQRLIDLWGDRYVIVNGERVHDRPNDCLYNAVWMFLTPDEKRAHPDLRRDVINWMHQEANQQHLTDNLRWDDMNKPAEQRIRELEEFAQSEDSEVEAIACLLEKTLYVRCPFGSVTAFNPGKPVINIGYIPGHFVAMFNRRQL